MKMLPPARRSCWRPPSSPSAPARIRVSATTTA